jgi:hypothetical protein
MTRVPQAHRAKAAELHYLHMLYGSWTQVHKQHFPTIPRGTLCTIAKSKGAKIPKKHWSALGLVEQGRRRREWLPGEMRTARKIGEMAKETREQVLVKK